MTDHRPANCRLRLRDEGKFYPRCCNSCGKSDNDPHLDTKCAKLKYNVPENLRWLALSDYGPDRVPCGELTGVFLNKAAEMIEQLAESSGGWIDHEGNQCPVANHTLVEVGFRGSSTVERGPASGFDWSIEDHRPCVNDVVRYRVIGISPSLTEPPEVPDYRFGRLVKGENYAYARGLIVAPAHLPSALDAMEADGWSLLAIFGQTDAENVGFIFKRKDETQ